MSNNNQPLRNIDYLAGVLNVFSGIRSTTTDINEAGQPFIKIEYKSAKNNNSSEIYITENGADYIVLVNKYLQNNSLWRSVDKLKNPIKKEFLRAPRTDASAQFKMTGSELSDFIINLEKNYERYPNDNIKTKLPNYLSNINQKRYN